MSRGEMPYFSHAMMKGSKTALSHKEQITWCLRHKLCESRPSLTLKGVRSFTPILTRDGVSSEFIRFLPSKDAGSLSRLPHYRRSSAFWTDKPNTGTSRGVSQTSWALLVGTGVNREDSSQGWKPATVGKSGTFCRLLRRTLTSAYSRSRFLFPVAAFLAFRSTKSFISVWKLNELNVIVLVRLTLKFSNSVNQYFFQLICHWRRQLISLHVEKMLRFWFCSFHSLVLLPLYKTVLPTHKEFFKNPIMALFQQQGP